jgi:hypothetical protein
MGNTRSASLGFRFAVIQQTNSENTFAVTLTALKKPKQNKKTYYEHT